jgi:predicted lysophospholipase L1 biosynthesis ABC-type transport system permease subunit
MGRGSFTPTGLGEGVMVSGPALAASGVPADERFDFILVKLHPGANSLHFENRLISAVAKADPNSDCSTPAGCVASPADRPAELANYARVRATPLILAGLLAVIAAAMIGHALVTSVRRRRHDLAILKTLGFVRYQVSATVAWQATTFAVVALALGLPIGVAVGRWIWTIFADQLGVPPEPVVKLPVILLAVPAVLLLANLIAAIPARIAARTQPAVVLRSE